MLLGRTGPAATEVRLIDGFSPPLCRPLPTLCGYLRAPICPLTCHSIELGSIDTNLIKSAIDRISLDDGEEEDI